MAVKHFSLFVSVDSIGSHAEYIRHGLDWSLLDTNVFEFLSNTNNTAVTFINTFNALSVPRIKEYLEYILDLRSVFSKQNQGVKSIPIYDPNYTHPDYIIDPRQRVWFDIPLLRSPEWQNIQILPKSFDVYLEDAIKFMKMHTNIDDYVGFYDFEIEKIERNLKILRETRYKGDDAKLHRTNFVKYFMQYDERKGTDFKKTFPEFANINNW